MAISIAINIKCNMLEEKLWNKNADEHFNKFSKNIVFRQIYFHSSTSSNQIKSNQIRNGSELERGHHYHFLQ